MRTSVVAIALLGLVLLGGGIWLLQEYREEAALRDAAERTASSYLLAWESEDGAQLASLTEGDGEAAAETHEAVVAGLDAEAWALDHDEAELIAEERARVPFRARVRIPGLGDWEFSSQLPLVLEDGGGNADDVRWLVDWSRDVIHPSLADGQVLRTVREWPDRQPILDRFGDPLEDAGASIGLLIGEVGEADEEMVEDLGTPYAEGDPVGTSALQRGFERRLAGEPGGEITIVDGDDEVVEVLRTVEPQEGRPVRTTIHPGVQRAAEAVIAGPPTALVVTDPATGELLAVTNHPSGDWNRAMQSRYPPGSTFKVVTAGALLRDGWEPDSPIDCPETTEVGGWTFQNFEDMDLGPIDLLTATYESCNTAYVQMAAELDDDVFFETAEDFGFNASLDLPISARGGSFPDYENVVVKAAAGFGQGQVESSPMQLATVAAAVADGTWRPPVLVLEPTPDERETRDVSDVAPTLREMMEHVVARGTAEGRGLPADVAGKTGTAEWGERGEDDELPTHAWFMGYAPWDDPDGEIEEIAFAVIVEGGEAGGRVAAPLAARFLGELRE